MFVDFYGNIPAICYQRKSGCGKIVWLFNPQGDAEILDSGQWPGNGRKIFLGDTLIRRDPVNQQNRFVLLKMEQGLDTVLFLFLDDLLKQQ